MLHLLRVGKLGTVLQRFPIVLPSHWIFCSVQFRKLSFTSMLFFSYIQSGAQVSQVGTSYCKDLKYVAYIIMSKLCLMM